MTVKVWLRLSFGSAVLFGLWGCGDGDPDDSAARARGSGSRGVCNEVESEIAWDEQTPLGFSAGKVALLVSEPRTETLAWLEGPVDMSAEGIAEVRVEVDLGERARFVERSFADDSVLKDGALADACNDRLALDATLTLTTADGQLDEVVETTLYAESDDLGSIGFNVPVDQLNGDLEVTYSSMPEHYEPDGPPEIWLSMQFDDEGWSGAVTARFAYEVEGEPAAAYFAAQIARWPADGP